MNEGMLIAHEWKPLLTESASRLLVDDEDRAAFEAVFARATASYAPRAWVRGVEIEAVGDDFAMLSGEWFDGQSVGRLLSSATRAWVYVATAGESPHLPEEGTLLDWWIKKLGEDAVQSMENHLASALPHGKGESVSAVSPGALPDFPTSARAPLFRLLGENSMNVTLTDGYQMAPYASACGILFASPKKQCSCNHCASGNCPKRCGAADATNIRA